MLWHHHDKACIQIFEYFSSKYIAGHTDVIAGCVTTKSMEHWERLKLQQFTTGSALVAIAILLGGNEGIRPHASLFQSPFDAALVARGLKTLPLRMDKICLNARAVAQFLAKHPKVSKFSFPLADGRGVHAVTRRGGGGQWDDILCAFTYKRELEFQYCASD